MTTRSSPRERICWSAACGGVQLASVRATAAAAAALARVANRLPGLGLIAYMSGLEYQPPMERYRSGHNGADSKSDGRVKPARGFESHPLRHSCASRVRCLARAALPTL